MGFFAWLREGVRRAVLLGFSDAIAEIGRRSDTEDLGEQLASTLQQTVTVGGAPHLLPPASPTSGRKRLGKSLQQIRGNAEA